MNSEKHTSLPKEHGLSLKSREHIEISGVVEVQSFDEASITVSTLCGEMVIEGEQLKIGTLDTERGIVSADGKICALYYTDDVPRRRRGIFSRSRD